MRVVSTTRVTQRQVDALGHLNHVAAMEMLEHARDDWYAAAGLWHGRPWSGSENLATLVLNININYRAECFLDQELKIVTRPLRRGGKSFALAQEIVKPDASLAIDGVVTSLVMDMQRHRTIPVPECMAQYFPPRGQDAASAP